MIERKFLLRRVIVYILGLLVLGFGTTLSINADLGVAPVVSVPYIISLIFDMHMTIPVFVIFGVFVLLQIAILRKDFMWINLTQLFFAFLFGFFTDFAAFVIGDFAIPTYVGRLATLGISIVLIAAGIVIFMSARLVNLPPEGLVDTIAQKIPGGTFYKVKIVMDSILVLIAVPLAFVFLGELAGIREGTFISAILIGRAIPLVERVILPGLRKAGL